MDWEIKIERKAQKGLKKIPDPYHSKIVDAIDELANEPRPHNCKNLKGNKFWRVRVGPYRIVYHIKEQQQLVLIIRIGHRSDVYRNL